MNRTDPPPTPVQATARLLLVPAFMVALAILVKGYADTGDGFSAGVIAALAILLQYVALGADETERLLPLRHANILAMVGLLISIAVAFSPVLRGEPIFTHVPGPGEEVTKLGTVELITPVAFDVGVFLLVLGGVVGALRLVAHPDPEDEDGRPNRGRPSR